MKATIQALVAALTFGLSAPFAKVLLDAVSPLFLAGLLYLGAGTFLSVVRMAGRSRSSAGTRLQRRDRWTLAGAVLTGGILAPPLLLWGLARSPATSVALLLNLEVVFTVLVAGVVFREHVGARVVGAAALMALGGISLEWRGGTPDLSPAALAVVAACALWALDNNLTRQIAEADPLVLVQVKGLAAGGVNLLLAVAAGQPVPPAISVGLGLGLGVVSYGISLVLFILAMRGLGAARTGAYFALAPFFGASGGVLIVGEPVTPRLVVAAALMAGGAGLLLRERHSHWHAHEPGTHTHLHVHDEHHQHAHEGWEGPEPHIHAHPTERLAHEHPHTPDLHHGHRHQS